MSEPQPSIESPPAPGPSAGETSRATQRAVVASTFALLLAVVAAMVAGFLWWQYRQFYLALDQTDAVAARELERVRADVRALQDDGEALGDDLIAQRQATSGLRERVDQLPTRFVDLERRLDAMQGASFDARSGWARSEAEYYLTVANTELTLAGHWENAITALELADGRLAELGDPALGRVREAIAGELLALRSVRLPDVEGLVFSLGRLASRIDELPLRADLPSNFAAPAEALAAAEPGLGRLWLGLKRALLGLVRIERRDEPVAEALSAAERLLSRRQLLLELELARVAILRTHGEAFRSSLQSAIALLQRDFAADTAEVEGALGLLNGMLALTLTPERPDISRSLNVLRSLDNGSN
jgi:uroporphyrin-3 C-methyltransferase